jgi:hypothetical protein
MIVATPARQYTVSEAPDAACQTAKRRERKRGRLFHRAPEETVPATASGGSMKRMILLLAVLCLFLIACGQAFRESGSYKHDPAFYNKIFPLGSDP